MIEKRTSSHSKAQAVNLSYPKPFHSLNMSRPNSTTSIILIWLGQTLGTQAIAFKGLASVLLTTGEVNWHESFAGRPPMELRPARIPTKPKSQSAYEGSQYGHPDTSIEPY
jgi:hypothetical protein